MIQVIGILVILSSLLTPEEKNTQGRQRKEKLIWKKEYCKEQTCAYIKESSMKIDTGFQECFIIQCLIKIILLLMHRSLSHWHTKWIFKKWIKNKNNTANMWYVIHEILTIGEKAVIFLFSLV